MAKNRIYVIQPNKGADTSIATAMIDEKSSPDMMNIRWNEGGTCEKRYGFAPWAETLSPSKGMGSLLTKIISIHGTKAYWSSYAGAAFTEITGGTFTNSIETYSLQQIKTRMFIWNGYDAGAHTDGATLSRPGTIPSAAFSAYYKGYHICAGTVNNPSRIYMSTIADTADFTNAPGTITSGPDPDNVNEVPGATLFEGALPDIAQFIDVSPSDNDKITMIHDFQDFLIICKRNSIWSMTIDPETNKPLVQLITRSAGCVANSTAVSVNNDLFFLSEYGVISLGNEKNYATTLRSNIISQKIQRVIDGITQSAWARCTASYFDNMYILSIPTDGYTTNNIIVAFDTRFGGWTLWDTLNPRVMLSHIDGNGIRHLLFAQEGHNDICEYIPNHYYDRMLGIDAWWKSKELDAGILDVTKRWTYLTLFMRNIGSTVACSINTELENIESANVFEGGYPAGLGFNLWGRNTLLGRSPNIENSNEGTISSYDDAWRTTLNLESRTLSFRIENKEPGENFIFAGFAVEFISLKAYYFDQSHTF